MKTTQLFTVVVAGLMLALAPQAEAADDIDITAALADAKKPKWDPKGSALTPFAQAKTKYRNKQYVESVPGFVEAIDKKAGCGECLDYLSSALYYAELYDEAIQVGPREGCGPVFQKLYDQVRAVQKGEAEDKWGWTTVVE